MLIRTFIDPDTDTKIIRTHHFLHAGITWLTQWRDLTSFWRHITAITQKFNDILLQRYNTLYNGEVIERWTEGCILQFPKKEDLSFGKKLKRNHTHSYCTKNLQLTASNRIQPKEEKVLRRNQHGFRKNRSTVGQILTVRRIIEGVRVKNL